MANLNRDQWIGVVVGIAFIAFLLYGSSFTSLFNIDTDVTTGLEDVSQEDLEVQDVTVGIGVEARAGDTLTVHYVGRLEDGKVFDSSIDRGEPFSFTVGAGQVIRGWDEGLIGMKEGGKRNLVISPAYGYGANSAGSIPPNSTLYFEVDLITVERP